MAGNDWERLAAYVAARMVTEKIRSKAELKRRSGLSLPTIDAILAAKPRGDSVLTETLGKLDDGLRWDFGSSAAVLAGGEPVDAERAEGGVVSRDEISRLAARVDETQAILRAMMSAMLTDRQRAAIAQEVAEAQSQGRAPLREA